jgi:hypothetical protein
VNELHAARAALQLCPAEPVDLASVEEELRVVLEFVGGDEHAVPVGAEQRLVRQARALGVAGQTTVNGLQNPIFS